MLCSVSYILTTGISFIVLSSESKSGDAAGWLRLFDIIDLNYRVFFITTIVLASSGWSIINVSLTLWQVLKAIAIPFFIYSLNLFVKWSGDGNWNSLVGFIQFILIIWLFKVVFESLDEAQTHVRAHLYLIAQENIDPVTTPIYEKYQI